MKDNLNPFIISISLIVFFCIGVWCGADCGQREAALGHIKYIVVTNQINEIQFKLKN